MRSRPSQCPLCKSRYCIVLSGHYGDKHRKRFKCKKCSKVFSQTVNTLRYRTRKKPKRMIYAIVSAYERGSIRNAASNEKIRPNTLCRWIQKMKTIQTQSLRKYVTEKAKNDEEFSEKKFWAWFSKNDASNLTKDTRRKWHY